MTRTSPVRRRCIAAVRFPFLALAVCPVGHRENIGVVVDPEKPSGPLTVRGVLRLHAVSPNLLAEDVRPGMRILDAQHLAPALSVQVVRHSAMRHELFAVAEQLLPLTPILEVDVDDETIFLDLTGLPCATSTRTLSTFSTDLLAQLSLLGHEAVVAVSPQRALSTALSRDVAWHAGRYGGRRAVLVPTSQVQQAIAHLEVGTLGLPPETVEGLRALGVHTGGALRRLTPAGGAARLLAEAKPVLRLLSGEDRTPLSPWQPPPTLHEDVYLDDEVSLLEPLLFVLKEPCARLCRRVQQRGEALSEVQLEVRGRDLPAWQVRLSFPSPIAVDGVLLSALQARLGVTGIPGPVGQVRLIASRTAGRGPRQADAFAIDDVAPEAISALLTELGDGEGGVLQHASSMLPEEQSRLCWPPLSTPRGRKAAASSSSSSSSSGTIEGRFMGHWPWPTRLLRAPVFMDDEDFAAVAPFARVSGVDARHRPFARSYAVGELRDGRRALLLQSPGEGFTLHGWFD